MVTSIWRLRSIYDCVGSPHVYFRNESFLRFCGYIYVVDGGRRHNHDVIFDGTCIYIYYGWTYRNLGEIVRWTSTFTIHAPLVAHHLVMGISALVAYLLPGFTTGSKNV
jgi:hypothetical protein